MQGDVSNRLRRAIAWRLGLPTLLLLFMSSLDRVNLSFAALHMNADLGLSPTQYAFAAGVVFIGYLGGQYPSILLLQRIGMSRWIACSAILWGSCAASSALVTSVWQLYILRFILGLAEGGLGPGILIYLSQFTSGRERASSFTLPMLAIPFSVILGGPISGWLIETTMIGLPGWRWMLLAEAAPTILLGIAAFFYFPDTPDAANWLSPAEKAEIADRAPHSASPKKRNDWSILLHAIIWLSALFWFATLSGAYGLIFWLPQVLKQLTDLSPLGVGIVNALPWIGIASGMLWGAKRSDRSGDRYHYVMIPPIIAGLALLGAALLGAGGAALVMLTLTGLLLGMAQGTFWALLADLLPPQGFAIGTVTINIAGSMSGLVTPLLIGLIREQTSSTVLPGFMLAAMLIVAGLTMIAIRRSGNTRYHSR